TLRWPIVRVLAGLCASWMLAACASEDDGGAGDQRSCMPGLNVACVCPNGRTSTASCLPNGSAAGPCACTDPVATGDAGSADASSAPPLPDAGRPTQPGVMPGRPGAPDAGDAS